MNALLAEPRGSHSVFDNRALRWGRLLDRVAAGDEAAFATLYDESSGLTFGLIMHILQDQPAAEDALIEAYGQVRDRAGSKPAECDSVSWLIGIARSAALARRPRGRPSWPRMHRASALDRLTPRQRTIIQMTYFGGLTAREVSGELQLPTELVMAEIRDAMFTLREYQTPALAG